MRVWSFGVVLILVGCGGASPTPASSASSASAPEQGAHEHGAPAGQRAHVGGGSHRGHHRDFSDVEAYAKRFDSPSRDAWQRPDEVVRLMGIAPGMTVADIGAGTGYFLAHLARAVGEKGKVFGLDVEPAMVRYMQSRIAKEGLVGVSARQCASDNVGLDPRSVDRLLIVNTWHHLDDRVRYARHLADTLRDGGSIWIVDFTMESDMGPPPAMRLLPQSILAELAEAGLDARIVEDETLPKQYVIRASRRSPR